MIDQSWKKSSFSGANPNCVECRTDSEAVDIRDTQHRHLGQISISSQEWRAFLAEIERF
ncbi:DUF397 domain-containing protein [Salinactinospora qingdaonensis]|uniref:DUF397 domain-containing protein n=1 Tax=Salinactinospora qingdaonensis TaxID=702744 RepID=UPI0031E8B333